MRIALICLGLTALACHCAVTQAEPLELMLRYRQEVAAGTGQFHTLQRAESWEPRQTALILCDVWDSHHSHGAVARVNELIPRLSAFVQAARARGVTIIHAPSGCMGAYAEHPSRQRATQVPPAADLPAEIGNWCYQIPAEEQGVYPLDQSDGGCDDEPEEHAQWQAALVEQGRNPKAPWQRQHPGIAIDPDRDWISDQGAEVWSILQAGGIQHVLLAGVHTNMCVLGRPFGLRQLSRYGKSVALVRDLTDTMYNPAMRPFVSHFTGTDLIVEHIEKWVCPTITSDQLLGGNEFRFRADRRPHLVIISAEDEYRTEVSLPAFAAAELGHEFRVSFIFGDATERYHLPGIELIDSVDLLLVSVRRRPLPVDQLAAIRRYVASGKPVVGIRTASHAFCLRNQPAPAGLADWPEFDAEVFGGSYTNHYGADRPTTVSVPGDSPLLAGLERREFPSGGSLYQVSPLNPRAVAILQGSIENAPPEPVAWSFLRGDGGRSFYTSLGHVDDFTQPEFRQLLKNALIWAAQAD